MLEVKKERGLGRVSGISFGTKCVIARQVDYNTPCAKTHHDI
jgi:hypothetical protein